MHRHNYDKATTDYFYPGICQHNLYGKKQKLVIELSFTLNIKKVSYWLHLPLACHMHQEGPSTHLPPHFQEVQGLQGLLEDL